MDEPCLYRLPSHAMRDRSSADFCGGDSSSPGAEPELAAPPSGASPANLDSLIEKARAQYPGQVPLFLGWYSDEPIVYVNLGPTPDTAPAGMRTALFDAYTGAPVAAPQFNEGMLYFIGRMHTDMVAGLPVNDFLGGKGGRFTNALIS